MHVGGQEELFFLSDDSYQTLKAEVGLEWVTEVKYRWIELGNLGGDRAIRA